MESLWELVPCPDIPLFELDYHDANSSVGHAASYFNDFHQGNESVSRTSSINGSMGHGNLTLDAAQMNLTFPCVDMTDLPTKDTFKRVMKQLNLYFTPVVIVIGATGNLLAFLVFTVTHLRRQSSSVYLASLALADMGFLLSLFIVWLTSVKIHLFTRHVWCQAVVYMTYVCTFLSVWYVVSFTVERYIIVWYPLRKDRFCTPRRARIVVLTLACAACIIYSFAPWTSGVVEIFRKPICIPFPHYYHFLTVMEGIDSTLTLIIPSTIVIVLNIRIIIKIISVDKQRRPFIRHNNYTARCRAAAPISDHKFSVHESLSTGHLVHVKFRPQSGGSAERPSSNAAVVGPSQSGANGGSNSPEYRRCSHSHSHSSDKPRFVAGLRTLADPTLEKHRCTQLGCCPEKQRVCTTSHTLGDKRRRRCVLVPKSNSSRHGDDTQSTRKSLSTTEVFRKCNARVHVRGHSQYRTARMLIVVSSVFVVLNLPSHVFRVHAFIQTSLTDQLASRGHTDVRWHELFQLVYHLNFAINFFIYSVCGRQFRTGLKILYSRLVHRLTKCQRAFLYQTTSAKEV